MESDAERRSRPVLPPLRQSAAWGLAVFAVLTLSFGFVYRADLTDAAGLVAMRAGTLADLVHELPGGRQALVSCLWLMPLPTLAALPFVFFLPTSSYGLAYLYALAAAGALAAAFLHRLLTRTRVRWPGALACAAVVAFCLAVVGTVWADTIMVMACLAGAFALEGSARPGNRALAGSFHGAALLAHPVGFVWAWLRIVVGGLSLLRRRQPEERAIVFVQFVQVAYACGIYLFLNAMIMRQPTYPFTHVSAWPTRPPAETVRELEGLLKQRYEGFAPVVSGPWGYLAQDVLARHAGYRVLDFHPDKMPAWEQRDILLIVPNRDNPLTPWQDVAISGGGQTAFPGRILLLESTRNWSFYLVSPLSLAAPGGRRAAATEDGDMVEKTHALAGAAT